MVTTKQLCTQAFKMYQLCNEAVVSKNADRADEIYVIAVSMFKEFEEQLLKDKDRLRNPPKQRRIP